MSYKWKNPYEWLMSKVEEWGADNRLKAEFIELAGQVDYDVLQDIYQPDMEEDGYFEQEKK